MVMPGEHTDFIYIVILLGFNPGLHRDARYLAARSVFEIRYQLN